MTAEIITFLTISLIVGLAMFGIYKIIKGCSLSSKSYTYRKVRDPEGNIIDLVTEVSND